MSKGNQMAKVITRKLKVGDRFKLPGNSYEVYEVSKINGDYLVYKNVNSNEEFQMVRGFAQTVDLQESADYQKKRFKEPAYMYKESKQIIKEAAERMIEKMRQEGMLINSMKVVSEAFKRNYNFNSGDKLILNTDFGDPTIKSKADHDPRFNETVIFSKRVDNLNAIVKNTKNSGHMNNSNPEVGEKVPLNILMTVPEYEQWKKTLEGRIAKGYENLDAEEKAKHLLSHPTSKYMSDLKSENITERAIRKAVKEMLGKPDKRDPRFIIDVNEEGEAPAIANTTTEIANPDLPLKLKEATKVPYLLKNAKVGDTFHDDSDLGREYKITRVTPSKVYATCVKDPNTTGEYNRSHSDYNETDPQWAKLYTIKY